MPAQITRDSLAPVKTIMNKHGVRCSPEAFQTAVNVTFHNFEAEVYDREHADMWESLPREFARLADDCTEIVKCHQDLHLLDIGCGTGLATDCLLKTHLGRKIKSVDLLDTSQTMLKKVAERARGWGIQFSIKEGLIDSVPSSRKYSLIVTCSVLHHVPDLPEFLGRIRGLQPDGGIFVHLQDPNGDYLKDPKYLNRVKQAEGRKLLPKSVARFTPKRVLGRIYRELKGTQHDSYCEKTNRELLQAGVIETPLSVAEIYAITDIHVVDGLGISVPRMINWMPEYDLISRRSYAFFGKLASELPPRFKRAEEDLAEKKALNGLHIGAAWKLRS
jgi:2-polyprenyl-3-methyl-5-hydroxy-6-metoxy-1,4-benzoquinol methylase